MMPIIRPAQKRENTHGLTEISVGGGVRDIERLAHGGKHLDQTFKTGFIHGA